MTSPPAIIITGGARGIGAATARLAAARGYAVCVNYQHGRGAAEDLVREIAHKGGHAVAVQADISSETGVLDLYRQVDSRLGKVSALVNNAATLERQMRLDTMDADRIMRTFAVNVLGSMLCGREAVRRMSTRHGGSGGAIVNVSSGAAKYGSPGEYVDYAASKGAIETFTVGLASEVAQDGIRVNAVRPGSFTPDCMPKAASLNVSTGSRLWCRCSGAVNRKRSPTPFSGFFPKRRRTLPGRSLTCPAAGSGGYNTSAKPRFI